MPECEVTATDTSAAALEVARANAERLGLAERVRFVDGGLPGDRVDQTGDYDLVLANLPYVSEAEWGSLQPDVTEWEPREALLAGPEGLDVFRLTLPSIAPLAPVVALEVGQGQAGVVGELLRDAGSDSVEVRRDLAGIERVVVGRRGAS